MLHGPVMDVESVRVYAAAHVTFIVLVVFLLTDFCEGPATLIPNYEFSIAGMEYISEKLMVCQHSSSMWQTLPHLIGAVLSVITLQLYAVFSALSPSVAPRRNDVIFMALSIVHVTAWGALTAFDHRRSTLLLDGRDTLHILSVALYLSCFCALHAMISYQYYRCSVITLRYSTLRRVSYFAVEFVHISMCVLFCIFAMINNVFHAILIEYIVAALFCGLNLASFAILLRVRAHAVSEQLDSEWI